MLLPYCIAESNPAGAATPGMRGAAVHVLEHAGLFCFVSQHAPPPREFTREDALAFHRVVGDVFRHVAVIPFRFPTLLPDEEELRAFLDPHAADYREELQRLREFVQMEVGIAIRAGEAAARGSAVPGRKPSRPGAGANDLHQRQAQHAPLEATAGQLKAAAGKLAHAWHAHEISIGLRCSALVARADVEEFRERLAELGALPHKVVVSGPWPATEFMAALHANSA